MYCRRARANDVGARTRWARKTNTSNLEQNEAVEFETRHVVDDDALPLGARTAADAALRRRCEQAGASSAQRRRGERARANRW